MSSRLSRRRKKYISSELTKINQFGVCGLSNWICALYFHLKSMKIERCVETTYSSIEKVLQTQRTRNNGKWMVNCVCVCHNHIWQLFLILSMCKCKTIEIICAIYCGKVCLEAVIIVTWDLNMYTMCAQSSKLTRRPTVEFIHTQLDFDLSQNNWMLDWIVPMTTCRMPFIYSVESRWLYQLIRLRTHIQRTHFGTSHPIGCSLASLVIETICVHNLCFFNMMISIYIHAHTMNNKTLMAINKWKWK